MTVYKLDSKVVLYNHQDYGTRLLFKNGIANPRNQLGEYGVSYHSEIGSYFYKSITVRAKYIDQAGVHRPQSFHIDRGSLVKYLGIKHELTDSQIIQRLKKTLWKSNIDSNTKKRKAELHAGKRLSHAGNYNKSKVFQRPFYHRMWTNFIDWLYQRTIQSINLLKIRFLFIRSEKSLFTAGERLAEKRFKQAYQHVPAYKKHVYKFNKGQFDPNLTFREIPVTDKDNYIKHQKHDSNTHFNGKYPNKAKTDTSTGTTGKPTVWVRGPKELEVVKKSLRLAQKIQMGDRNVNYINAFAFGPWATGLTTYELMRGTGSVFASGADKDKILDKLINIYDYEQHQLDLELRKHHFKNKQTKKIVHQTINKILYVCLEHKDKQINPTINKIINALSAQTKKIAQENLATIRSVSKKLNAEKSQIMIAGYPPFLKDLVEYVESKGHDFKKFRAMGVVGGQAMSEAMRDQLVKKGFRSIHSSYGASDLDINLGIEGDDEIMIRKQMEKNPSISRELCGKDKGLPMVFHYDPLNYHVETDKNGYLLFTCARSDRSSPRIRYRLGDQGRVYASSDVGAVLAKHNIFYKPKTNLPLMFIWGRDSDVVYNGANLSFTNLERAICNTQSLEDKVLKKAFYTYQDKNGDEQLEIWLELNDKVPLPNEKHLQQCSKSLFSKLVALNQDFRWQIQALDADASLPKIRFFKRHESPISEADGHRKQVLVFKKGVNIAKDYVFPSKEKCKLVALKKNEIEINSPAQIHRKMKHR